MLEFNRQTLEVFYGNNVVACWCDGRTPIKEKLNRSKHTFIVDMAKIEETRNKMNHHFKTEELHTSWSQWEKARAIKVNAGEAQ